jgi:hypothetical protein
VLGEQIDEFGRAGARDRDDDGAELAKQDRGDSEPDASATRLSRYSSG